VTILFVTDLGVEEFPPSGGGATVLDGDVTGPSDGNTVSLLQGQTLTITGPLAAGEVLAPDAGGTAIVNADIATVLGYDPAANLGALGIPDPTSAPDGQVVTTASGVYVLAAVQVPIQLLAGVVTTVLGADTVAGYGYVDPTGLASLTLAAVGQVVSGVIGTLDLYDLTAAAVVATLTWIETAPTRKTASVTVPGTARLYELRVRKSGGGASDYALFSSVSLIGS
jgi:hypothetical protein